MQHLLNHDLWSGMFQNARMHEITPDHGTNSHLRVKSTVVFKEKKTKTTCRLKLYNKIIGLIPRECMKMYILNTMYNLLEQSARLINVNSFEVS